MNINELEKVATQVRRDIIRMVHGCQSGHPGGSLGATDIVTALFFDQMDIDPASFRMDGKGEDMFFLSNGHISPMLYSIMARRGYFPVSELATFRRLGTRLRPPHTNGGSARHPHRLGLARTRTLRRLRRCTSQETQWRQTPRLRPHG